MKRFGADFDSANTLHLDEARFKEVIKPNAMTISRFLRTNFVVPEWNEFCRHIFRLYSLCKNNDSGEPSNFIPQLAAYDKNLWGIALCSVDGQRFSTGDYNVPFCLQATSRVLNYAIALNDLGPEKVHSFVGQEPSGRNAKELVLDECQKPHNPMINGGAIVISALLKAEEKHMADRFDAVDSMYKKMAGNNEFIGFCNQAYLSERQVSFRNYAMGYFLRENKCLPEPERLNETLELMLQLCAVEVSCESLAVMAATLANGGVCPITGEYVIGSQCVRDVLSLMYTTGMNDYSGQFAFHVGLPAKSSISGAIMLVIPNVMGIAMWSPPLDNRNNSVRGIQFCTELVKAFNFHNYDNLRFTQKKMDPRKMQVENKAHQVVLTLFSAANGDLTALSRFYLQGVDLTVADYDRRTPLHIASAEGHLNCVKFLVEKARVPCRPVDRWNNTPADDARYHAHPEIADYLENWDMKRVASASQLQLQPSTPAVNGITSLKTPETPNIKPVAMANLSPKSRDGYDASQSEEEEEDYDSGEGSSVPGSASVLSKGTR
jgi:glutaminase